MGGNLVGQRGGNQGFDGNRILRHGALLDSALADIIQQQNAHLVAGNQLIGAVRAADGNAHPVGIRVGGQHQVGTGLLGQLQTQAQSLKNLRVGIGAGGEIAVGILLLGDNGNVRNADVVKYPGDRHQAGAVQGRIHQLQPRGCAQAGTDRAGLDGIVQSFLAVLAHIGNEPLGLPFLEGHPGGAGENIGFLNLGVHHRGGIVRHLAAIGAVGLVAVVFGRIVRGGNHDTGVGMVIAGGKGQSGHGHQRVINAHFDAVGGQNAGGLPGKHVGIDPAVVGNGNRLTAPLGFDPVGKTLGGLPHHINIHPVGARAQDSPEACGAEFQCHGEPLLDLILLTRDFLQFPGQGRILQRSGAPTLIILHVHYKSPFPCCIQWVCVL